MAPTPMRALFVVIDPSYRNLADDRIKIARSSLNLGFLTIQLRTSDYIRSAIYEAK